MTTSPPSTNVEVTPMEQPTMSNESLDHDRARATEMLAVAQHNPVLSDTQSCSVAQVYALLAIEQRLAQLCATLDTALVALADLSRPADPTSVAGARTVLS